ncbi:MAG: oxidoreductase [Rhizobiaceae bacterium]|nr:oxidoreductase [Rhizobiaceae bacterium]
MFKGILVEKDDAGYRASLRELSTSDLPEGDVTVSVEWSTLNYKDALAITGKSPVVRRFPLVPGIDMAGKVKESSDPAFKVGDAVLLNGYGVGETHSGGLAGEARVRSEWLLHIPEGLDARRCMSIGTAGYTAMLCIMALERNGVKPESGEIAVTGATGGVGSFAVALLARRGYKVVASTGKANEADYLKKLGASEIIDRAELSAPGKPLGKERWAGAVDSVGGTTLANLCATTRYGGTVAACGLAQSMDFPATVAPFILRGVTLAGIDSVYSPLPTRKAAWDALARELDTDLIDAIGAEISLEDCIKVASDLLDGKIRGRVLVRI